MGKIIAIKGKILWFWLRTQSVSCKVWTSQKPTAREKEEISCRSLSDSEYFWTARIWVADLPSVQSQRNENDFPRTQRSNSVDLSNSWQSDSQTPNQNQLANLSPFPLYLYLKLFTLVLRKLWNVFKLCRETQKAWGHNRVYILSSRHTYRPMRVRVLS